MLLRGQFKELLLHSAGCSSPFNKKIRKFFIFGRQFTHKAVHTYAKSDTKPPFARSISTYRVVFQPPGLKSDILHENSLTNRQQPFTSSHIIAFPADQSRKGIHIYIYLAVTQVLLYSIFLHFARDFLFFSQRIFHKFSADFYSLCTTACPSGQH